MEDAMARLLSFRRRGGYVTRRAADYLHDRVDRVANSGEFVERRLRGAYRGLQSGYQLIGSRAQRLSRNVKETVGGHPWTTMFGSMAVGFLVGMLSTHRR
jgi:ElaB/YqjD/DUF883 family membrane-anchored ribosome-binding protein